MEALIIHILSELLQSTQRAWYNGHIRLFAMHMISKEDIAWIKNTRYGNAKMGDMKAAS